LRERDEYLALLRAEGEIPEADEKFLTNTPVRAKPYRYDDDENDDDYNPFKAEKEAAKEKAEYNPFEVELPPHELIYRRRKHYF
jgi:hypothetical protein